MSRNVINFNRGLIESVTEASLNALCKAIQDTLGQDDGGLAGQYWAGAEASDFNYVVVKYVGMELEKSFERFQESRRYTNNVAVQIPNGSWELEDEVKGFVYVDSLFIEIVKDGSFQLEVCRDGHRSQNLQELELILFEFAVSEGHMEKLACKK
jgi:hypothetical protein